MPSATPPALARVTVSAPQRRLDVAVAGHAPVAELLPDLLRHAGEGLADDGERHGGWVLRRADGRALRAVDSLHAQDVRDGEVLHLVPARLHWPELAYDDVAEEIAANARRQGSPWTPAATRVTTVVAAGLLLAVVLAGVLHAGPRWHPGSQFALGTAFLLGAAAVLASRAYGDGGTAVALGGFALPYAFAGGALLVPGPPAGPLPALAWLGAPQALVGSVALLLAGVLGWVGVGVGLPVFAAAITVGLLGAPASCVAFVTAASGAAAVTCAVLVCGIGALPVLAIRLGRLPVPGLTPLDRDDLPAASFAGPSGVRPAGARERPSHDPVQSAVARAEGLLTGMLAGHAVLVLAAAAVLLYAGGLAGRLLVAVAGTALLLRARLFIAVRHRLSILVGGLAGLTGLVGTVLVDTGAGGGLPAVAGTALLIVLAGGSWSVRSPSPYLGRAVDLLDTATAVAVVPVACAVLGFYAKVRGLAG